MKIYILCLNETLFIPFKVCASRLVELQQNSSPPSITKYPSMAQKSRLTDLDAKLKFFSTTLKIPVWTEFKVEPVYYNLKNSLMDGSGEKATVCVWRRGGGAGRVL